VTEKEKKAEIVRLEEGCRFKKHSGVRAAFNREIIKTGRMEQKHGDLYNEIFAERQAGDNVAFTQRERSPLVPII